MMPGMMPDPEKMQKVQSVSQFIKGTIKVDYSENTILIKFDSKNEEALTLIPGMLSQLPDALAMQLQAFFAIQGEIIEKNKPQ